MNKHRIVGFVVVVALIVIVTELLLNYHSPSKVSTIEIAQPPMPELVEDSDSINIQQLNSNEENGSLADDEATQNNHGNESPLTDMPTTKAASSDKNSASSFVNAWVVQLASVTDRSRADQLVSRLRAHGFDAFSYSVVSNGKKYIRINAGPVATSADAKKLMQNLKQKEKLQGILVRYSPSNEGE